MQILIDDCQFTSEGIWLNLAITPGEIFELEILNTFMSNSIIPFTLFLEDHLEVLFWDKFYIQSS